MKRESGETPGQTRCCDSYTNEQRTSATLIQGEGLCSGISQKTCQLYDRNHLRGLRWTNEHGLPFFTVIRLPVSAESISRI
jgi:hypothetical protein